MRSYSYFSSPLTVSEYSDPVHGDFRREEWQEKKDGAPGKKDGAPGGSAVRLRQPRGILPATWNQQESRLGWAGEGAVESLAQRRLHKSWDLPMGGCARGRRKGACPVWTEAGRRGVRKEPRNGHSWGRRTQEARWQVSQGHRGSRGLSNGSAFGDSETKSPGNTFPKSIIVSVVLGKINWHFKKSHKV